MEDCLKKEIEKLKDDEIYCEVGANNRTLHLAFNLNKNIQIYAIDDEYNCGTGMDDPCVRINFIQGKSKDVYEEWWRESDQSYISVLLINEDFEKNFKLWHNYVKPKGTIIMNTTNFVDLNYEIERNEKYLKISL